MKVSRICSIVRTVLFIGLLLMEYVEDYSKFDRPLEIENVEKPL